MLLFLDIISSIPEFCVIDDNKIILQQKITQSETDKLSDNIIQSYIEIDKTLNLTKNLKKISTTIGPGSYTSLRVGSAFLSGLMISRKIPYYPLSIEDIIKFNSIDNSIEFPSIPFRTISLLAGSFIGPILFCSNLNDSIFPL